MNPGGGHCGLFLVPTGQSFCHRLCGVDERKSGVTLDSVCNSQSKKPDLVNSKTQVVFQPRQGIHWGHTSKAGQAPGVVEKRSETLLPLNDYRDEVPAR